MSEKIIHPESHKSHENSGQNTHAERLQAHHEKGAEKARAEQSEVNLAELREQAQTHAEKASKVAAETIQDEITHTPLGAQRALKNDAYKHSLKTIQKKLPKAERTLSKVVHNKTVDAISNVGSVTVARPSGVLGGSICAFVGSVILLYSAKHYGFRYNYLMIILLFGVGFLVGSVLELLIWSLYGRRKKQY